MKRPAQWMVAQGSPAPRENLRLKRVGDLVFGASGRHSGQHWARPKITPTKWPQTGSSFTPYVGLAFWYQKRTFRYEAASRLRKAYQLSQGRPHWMAQECAADRQLDMMRFSSFCTDMLCTSEPTHRHGRHCSRRPQPSFRRREEAHALHGWQHTPPTTWLRRYP